MRGVHSILNPRTIKMSRSCPLCSKDQKNVWTHLDRVHGVRGDDQRKLLGSKRPINVTQEGNGGTAVFGLKHPFTMVLSGPTSCGKTSLVSYILQHAQSLIDPPPERIVWLYKRWQPLYDVIQEAVKPTVEFIQGIPTGLEQDYFFDPRVRNLIVLDDLMSAASKDSRITDLFTEGSHHRNLSVLCLNQNLYFSKDPTQRRNSHYIVLFKNPIDKQQIMTLARQMYPENTHDFMKHFEEATHKPYGYLLIDLKQSTPDDQRLRPNVFQEGFGYNVSATKDMESYRQVGPTVIIDASECPVCCHNEKPGYEVEYKRDTSAYTGQLLSKSRSINMHSCAHCGTLFQTLQDMQRHILKRCPERDNEEDEIVPKKRFRYDSTSETGSEIEPEDDDSVLHDLVQKAYDENDEKYQKQVDIYSGEGMEDIVASSKADEDLLPQNRRLFLDKYGKLLESIAKLNHSPIHRKVTNEIDRLILGEDYSRKEAIKYALKKRKYLFDELFENDDDDDDESEEEEDSEHVESDTE